MSAIRTAENKSHDLGTANKRFKDLYVGGINADGAITATSLTINGNSVAAVDNTDLSTLQNPSTEIAPSQQATKSYVDSQVSAVIDAAPDALNTLNELAAALNDDAGLGATVTANSAKLANIENNATADQTGAEIKALYEAEADTNAFTDAQVAKLAGIEAGATGDQTGAEIKALYEAENDTNAFTDALKTKLEGLDNLDQLTGAVIKQRYEAEADTNAFTDAQVAKLAGIEANATADQTKADIDALGIDAASVSGFTVGASVPADAVFTDTTYAVQDGELSQNNFTNDLKTKLDGIEANATADQTKADIDALNIDAASVSGFTVGVNVPADAVFTDTTYAVQDGELSQNNFTNALKTKLDGIEANATADQTKADIDALNIDAASVSGFTVGVNVPADAVFTDTTYAVQDGELSQNNFTNALKTKLDGIEASADVTDATNVAAAGAVMSTDADASGYSFVIDEDTLVSDSDTKVPTQQSVKAYVDTQVSNIIGGAPEALDTLNELAAALGDDSSFATSVTNSLAGKASTTTQVIAGSGLSGGGTLAADRTLAVSGLTLTHFADAAVQTSAEAFADVDTAVMTAAAVADKIESYNYATAQDLNLNNYMPVAGGTFSGSVQVNGTLTIKGDLIQIDNGVGDPDSVSFHDANIVIDADNSGADVADGAGITIDGGTGDDVTLQWNSIDSRMELKQGANFASLKVDSILSTGGQVDAVASSAEKLDHAVTFAVTGAVTGSAASTLEGDTVSIATSINVDSDDINEGAVNLYYTDARAQAAISAGGDLNYANGVVSFTERTDAEVNTLADARFTANLATSDTDDLTEGAVNLYYTDARAQAAISVGGDLNYANGVVSFTERTDAEVNTLADARFTANLATSDTDDVSEGAVNLYYTDARAQSAISVGGDLAYANGVVSFTERTDAEVNTLADARFTANLATSDTDDLAEGAVNLYYTDARAQGAISAGGDLSYANGVVSFTERTDAEVNTLADARFTANLATSDTDDLAEGAVNLYYTDARAQASITVSGDGISKDNGNITITTIPISLGGTAATTASDARDNLEVIRFNDADRGSAWILEESGADTLVTMGTEVDGHSGSWKIISRLETTAADGNITSVSLVADYQVRPSSRINKLKSLPDTLWNIPEDGVLQLR